MTIDRLPPSEIINGAVTLLRAAFRDDGAEGETVHLICDVLELYRREADKAVCSFCGDHGPKAPAYMVEHAMGCSKRQLAYEQAHRTLALRAWRLHETLAQLLLATTDSLRESGVPADEVEALTIVKQVRAVLEVAPRPLARLELPAEAIAVIDAATETYKAIDPVAWGGPGHGEKLGAALAAFDRTFPR